MSAGTYFPGRGTLVEEKYLEGKADGKAEGVAEAVLRVLESRRLVVSDEARDRIHECRDLDRLGRWLDLSFTAPDADALFAGDGEGGA